MRTDACGQLRREDVGRTVRLGGWVHRSRDLGGLIFIDLRDRTGLVQLAFGPAWSSANAATTAAAVGVESVVLCEGEVVARDFLGMTIWGRGTTGQAISMDYVILQIAKECLE